LFPGHALDLLIGQKGFGISGNHGVLGLKDGKPIPGCIDLVLTLEVLLERQDT
jgi:hypothetical protein